MGGLRIVRADGDAFERGRQIGVGLGDLVTASLHFHRARLADRGVAPARYESLLEPYLDALTRVLPDQAAELRGMADGAALAELAPPPGTGSAGRQERLDRLLAERPPETIDDVMAILRDHESSPDAICLHSADPNGDEAWSVLFSMVCDVDAGRMWVAVGNPCECQYEEVDLSDVL